MAERKKPKISREDWDHAHWEKAFAVFLHEGGDDEPAVPAAVFTSVQEAEAYIKWQRKIEMSLDRTCGDRPTTKEEMEQRYLPYAGIMEVRNCYIPYLNSYTQGDEETIDPPAVPDYAMDDLRHIYPMPVEVNAAYRQALRDLKTTITEVLSQTKSKDEK